jgi:hypothetical protein
MAQYEHLPLYKKAMDRAVTRCQQLAIIINFGEHNHA